MEITQTIAIAVPILLVVYVVYEWLTYKEK